MSGGTQDRPEDHAEQREPGGRLVQGELPGVDLTGQEEEPLWRRVAADRWGDGPLQRTMGYVVLALGVGLTLFQLWIVLAPMVGARQQRQLHLVFVLVLVFLVVPPAKRAWARSRPVALADMLLVGAAVAVSFYPILNRSELARRAGAYTEADWLLGALLVVLLLEATRRTVGWFMSALVLAFLLYAWVGPLIPGRFGHSGATVQRLSTHLYLGDGIYGLTLGVVVTYVFIFILFGAVLQKSGGGNFFIGLAYCLTGRSLGGPAKSAVIGSALMGSVSGTAIGNTVTTGAFTIPMMKRVGYKPHEAGGVEAAASTGGQVLPPIMGAGAFLIAERTGIPYADIVKVAVLPALLYFGTVYLFVHILARKHGLGGMAEEDVPVLRQVVAAGWHFLAPLVLLITLMLNYVPPMLAGVYATGALFAVAMLRAGSRMDLRDTLEICVLAARNTMPVTIACAIAGAIVGVVGLTGLGLTLSDWLVSAFAGSLLLTLLMVALASLVLGIGLPVTAAYVVLIILAGPALESLGLAVIVTHMIVYWYSQDSNVTPPVALAAFAAAGIAGSTPMRTAASAWKFAKGLYLIPLMMAYSGLLLQRSGTDAAVAVVTGGVALAAFAIALEGFLYRRAAVVERVGLSLGAAMIVVAPEWSSWTRALVGADVSAAWFTWGGTGLALALVALQVKDRGPAEIRRTGPPAAPAAQP